MKNIKGNYMKINHIAIYLSDLEEGRAFFEKYFGGKAGNKYENSSNGFSSYFISFEDDVSLELMSNTSLLEEQRIDKQIGFSHIAFSVGTKEKVLELTEQLRTDGYLVFSEPHSTGDGYFESCVSDSEGNRIEITI